MAAAAPSSDGDRRSASETRDRRAGGALQSGHVSPPRRRHAARQLVCSAWPHRSIVALSPSASKQTQQSSAAAAFFRRGGVASPWTRRRSRRVATSTADAVALAHAENRAASRTARNDATRATAAGWPRSGHVRGGGLAAPTLK